MENEDNYQYDDGNFGYNEQEYIEEDNNGQDYLDQEFSDWTEQHMQSYDNNLLNDDSPHITEQMFANIDKLDPKNGLKDVRNYIDKKLILLPRNMHDHQYDIGFILKTGLNEESQKMTSTLQLMKNDDPNDGYQPIKETDKEFNEIWAKWPNELVFAENYMAASIADRMYTQMLASTLVDGIKQKMTDSSKTYTLNPAELFATHTVLSDLNKPHFHDRRTDLSGTAQIIKKSIDTLLFEPVKEQSFRSDGDKTSLTGLFKEQLQKIIGEPPEFQANSMIIPVKVIDAFQNNLSNNTDSTPTLGHKLFSGRTRASGFVVQQETGLTFMTKLTTMKYPKALQSVLEIKPRFKNEDVQSFDEALSKMFTNSIQLDMNFLLPELKELFKKKIVANKQKEYFTTEDARDFIEKSYDVNMLIFKDQIQQTKSAAFTSTHKAAREKVIFNEERYSFSSPNMAAGQDEQDGIVIEVLPNRAKWLKGLWDDQGKHKIYNIYDEVKRRYYIDSTLKYFEPPQPIAVDQNLVKQIEAGLHKKDTATQERNVADAVGFVYNLDPKILEGEVSIYNEAGRNKSKHRRTSRKTSPVLTRQQSRQLSINAVQKQRSRDNSPTAVIT